MRLRSIAAATGLVAALIAVPAQAAPGLKTGCSGPEFLDDNAGFRNAWHSRAAAAKASIVRIDVIWSALAPSRPTNQASLTTG